LDLVRPLVTAQGPLTSREGIVLSIGDGEGHWGRGDAAPVPGFSGETWSDAASELERFCKERPLEGMELSTLKEIEGFMDSFSASASTQNAIEQALVDLMAQRMKTPLSSLLNFSACDTVQSGCLVQSAADARACAAVGFLVFKVKVGGAPLDKDLERVQAIAKALPPGSSLRLDANRSLRFDDARRLLAQCAHLPIEYVEEPLVQEEAARTPALRAESRVPIALDESVVEMEALRRALEEEAMDVVVLKSMMCGGPLQALKRACLAQWYGVDTCFTSSLESVVGRLGTLHVAAALSPESRRAVGLNTGVLLKEDLGDEPEIKDGIFSVPTAPGIGLRGREWT
jgi:o-succinylbenzoate synthase